VPRDLPLSNGSLLVNFDAAGQLRDVYFPHVGMENHTQGGPCRLGVWAGGAFRWLSDPGWVRDLRYWPGTLVTRVRLFHPALELGVEVSDAVDMSANVLVRRFELHELSGEARDVRIFLHHDFRIFGNADGDTAYYEPQRRCVFHYKGRRWFLVNGGIPGEGVPGIAAGVHQWATGIKEFRGAEGTWRDAEDGILSGNPIAQGSVDSTVGIRAETRPGRASVVYSWLAAGTGFEEVAAINRAVVSRGPEEYLGRTRAYWELWVDKSEWDFGGVPDEAAEAFRRSLLVLRTQIDHDGGITAANDHDIVGFSRDTYSYVWPRDGALVARALDLAGHVENSRAFFDFCHRVITKEGYFLHKYNPDGSLASSWHPWQGREGKQLPVQEDETGLVVWALWNHVDRYRDVEWMRDKYRGLVVRAADWMASYVDPATGLPHPSYDLWEERYGVHAFTVAAVWAGLVSASRFAWRFNEGHLAQKWKSAADGIRAAADRFLYRPEWGRFARTVTPSGDGSVEADGTLDASLCGLWQLGMYPADDRRIEATMDAVFDRLRVRTGVGGIARYENDGYHRITDDVGRVPGNPWFVCTLWQAQWHIARARSPGDLAPALDLLMWAANRALPSGVLAEQVHPFTDAPLSVSPLTWSHAAYVTAFLGYLERRAALDPCPGCGRPAATRRP
jgi:GH15 family glucan-1,4-alpha-glucosidase